MARRPVAAERRTTGRARPVLAVLVWLAVGLTACGGRSSPVAPAPADSASPFPQFSDASFREAARITAAAMVSARQAARAGMFERDLKTIIDGVFFAQGSGPLAFPHIVASGPNTLEVHYADDGRQLQAGDLVLVDIGATADGHCADVTRTFPVDGQFTARQLELYQLVLDVHEFTAMTVRPGFTLAGLHAQVRERFRASNVRALDENGVAQTMDHFFAYGVGHFIGREVHGGDTGWTWTTPLAPHQAIALEPGLYIPSEHLAVRLEDTYLVTDRGLECLSCMAPKEF